jgi:hypothetical protein
LARSAKVSTCRALSGLPPAAARRCRAMSRAWLTLAGRSSGGSDSPRHGACRADQHQVTTGWRSRSRKIWTVRIPQFGCNSLYCAGKPHTPQGVLYKGNRETLFTVHLSLRDRSPDRTSRGTAQAVRACNRCSAPGAGPHSVACPRHRCSFSRSECCVPIAASADRQGSHL